MSERRKEAAKVCRRLRGAERLYATRAKRDARGERVLMRYTRRHAFACCPALARGADAASVVECVPCYALRYAGKMETDSACFVEVMPRCAAIE